MRKFLICELEQNKIKAHLIDKSKRL